MSAPLSLEKGGTAELLALEGDHATLRSPDAAAPGSRLGLKVDGRTLRLKVHRCHREEDAFVIAGRFIDLTRDLKQRLEHILRS